MSPEEVSTTASRLESPATEVLALARASGKSVSGAESCTGGLVAETITSVPGASDAFLGCVVAYSRSSKTRILGVNAETIEREGTVSAKCAEEMALGARNAFGSDVSYAVTGIAGPGPGEGKPEGTIWFGFTDLCGRVFSEKKCFSGGRRSVREQAVSNVLRTLASLLRAGDSGRESSS